MIHNPDIPDAWETPDEPASSEGFTDAGFEIIYGPNVDIDTPLLEIYDLFNQLTTHGHCVGEDESGLFIRHANADDDLPWHEFVRWEVIGRTRRFTAKQFTERRNAEIEAEQF